MRLRRYQTGRNRGRKVAKNEDVDFTLLQPCVGKKLDSLKWKDLGSSATFTTHRRLRPLGVPASHQIGVNHDVSPPEKTGSSGKDVQPFLGVAVIIGSAPRLQLWKRITSGMPCWSAE
jgi:hypothetical protein